MWGPTTTFNPPPQMFSASMWPWGFYFNPSPPTLPLHLFFFFNILILLLGEGTIK